MPVDFRAVLFSMVALGLSFPGAAPAQAAVFPGAVTTAAPPVSGSEPSPTGLTSPQPPATASDPLPAPSAAPAPAPQPAWPTATPPGAGPHVGWPSPGVAPAAAPWPATTDVPPASSGPPRPRRAVRDVAQAEVAPVAPLPPLGLEVRVALGASLVRSSAFDPFSTHDGLSQSTLAIGWRPSRAERSGLGLGVAWSRGSTQAPARLGDASLTTDRLSLVLDARIPVLFSRLAGFARLAPGLQRVSVQLVELSVPAAPYDEGPRDTLKQSGWTYVVAASAGLAFALGHLETSGLPVFGLWLTAEGGYCLAGSQDLTLTSGATVIDGRIDEPVRFGQLALGGPFMRFGLAVGF